MIDLLRMMNDEVKTKPLLLTYQQPIYIYSGRAAKVFFDF